MIRLIVELLELILGGTSNMASSLLLVHLVALVL